ncbi:MAG TPA: hypothetical protein VJV78_10700 [Polyangiales bacterium]|nr:hypothetical protein [Polyangiales bacterium]
MKLKEVMHDRHLTLACALALAACAGDAEIGSDVCTGDGVHCEQESPTQIAASAMNGAPAVAVSPESLARLEHTSALEPLGDGELLSYELITDEEGTLWEFALQYAPPYPNNVRGEGRLRVRTTSLAGDVQQLAIEPPWEPSAESRADYLEVDRNSKRGPSLSITWSPPDCRQKQSDCTVREALTFASGADMPPERTKPKNQAAPSWLGVFAAQAKGRWTVVTGPRAVEQRTRGGELIWRQTVMTTQDFTPNFDSTELLDTGELVFVGSNTDGRWPELWRIAFDGNVTQRVDLAPLTYRARLVHDSQRRALIAGVGQDGGIFVLRDDGKTALRSWDFLRTQYSELTVSASGVDLADNLYLLTESGGRDDKNHVPILCRVQANDTSDCFVLDKPAEAMGRPLKQMRATGPGIVYVGDGQRLFRYELPND